ncbi:hypothetical protein N9E50_02165 [Alphaproteobacteria bacterium]|nr:hypothetical protein [Alphaproteobacteria bacterium]
MKYIFFILILFLSFISFANASENWISVNNTGLACECVQSNPGECKPRIEKINIELNNKNSLNQTSPILIWDFFEFNINQISDKFLTATLNTESIILKTHKNDKNIFWMTYSNTDPSGVIEFICVINK